MRIAFVYDTVYPWVTGGAERRLYEIGTRLAKHGHDIHIFSLGYWMKSSEYKDKEVIQYKGMTLHSVGKPRELYNAEGKRSIKEALYFARCLYTKSELKHFDIVDCQGFPYFSCFSSHFQCKFGSSTLVITLHEVWNDYWYEYLGKKGAFGKFIEKRVFHLTDNVLCVSELTKDNMLENYHPKNTVVIPNGVDTKKITYIDPSENFCNVLFAGRLIPEKHVDLLIDAVKQVSKVHPFVRCIIIGEGPMEDYLKKRAKDLQIEDNIIFKKFYEKNEDVYRSIKASSLLVLPSMREGFGIIVLEANACGVPVVTIDAPLNAAKYLIQEGKNGWVIPDNIDVLADLIIQVMDKGISHELRNSCRNISKQYDWNHITILIENYYRKILKEQ